LGTGTRAFLEGTHSSRKCPALSSQRVLRWKNLEGSPELMRVSGTRSGCAAVRVGLPRETHNAASGQGSPHRQPCQQNRPQVHCQRTRDHQHTYPTHFSTAHSAPSAAPAASSSRLVTCRIVSYKTCVSASRRSGEGKKRRPEKPSGKRRGTPGQLLDLSNRTLDFD
jgi:hypothetical protein